MVTYDARPSSFTQLSTTADWESFITNCGIFSGVPSAGNLAPSLDSAGRNAVMSAGTVMIKGQLWRCDAPVSTPIPAASAQNRYDRLVMRLNRTASTSPTVVSPVVIVGTSGGGLPAISQSPAGNWDIPISHWTSGSNGTLTALVDDRVYASRGVAPILSTAHPIPELACIGMELDTGNVFSYTNNAWSPVGGMYIADDQGNLGDVQGWVDQGTLNFSLAQPTLLCAASYLVGTRITSGPGVAHVSRVTIDGRQYELGRDRQVPVNDPSSISGTWIGWLQPGNHSVIHTAYASAPGAWRLTVAELALIGF
jgi:hypothetical protein